MTCEYHIFGRSKSSIFDLIGVKEINQTTSLGYLFYKSKNALKILFSLIGMKSNYDKVVINCEQRQVVNNKQSFRYDITLDLFKKQKHCHSIIIEAKNLSLPNQNQNSVNQLIKYNLNIPSKGVSQTLVSLTRDISMQKSSYPLINNVSNIQIVSISWNALIQNLLALTSKRISLQEKELITDFVNYIINIKGAMKFYEKEVMSIPAAITLSAVNDPNCALYECPSEASGSKKNYQYIKRGKTKTLYIAFRKRYGVVEYLYKIQDVVNIDLNDTKEISNLASFINDPNISNRINTYKKYFPNVSGRKWLFIIDHSNSIKLQKPISLGKGIRNHKYHNLKDFFP